MPSEVMVIPISQSLKHSLQIKNSSEISEPKSITWNDAKEHTIPGRSFKVDGIWALGLGLGIRIGDWGSGIGIGDVEIRKFHLVSTKNTSLDITFVS